MFFFGKLFERGKGLIPQLRKVVAEQCQPLWIQLVNPARALPAVAHQLRIFQDAQVLRNGRPRYREAGGKLVHRLRVVAQHLEDGQPGGITERRQSVLYVSIHLP